MALINNIYIHVVNEQVTSGVDSTSHSVEKGLDITDTIRVKPKELSLSGKIANAGNMKAPEIISKIEKLMNKGSLIKYRGRRKLNKMQIQSFNHSHPYTNSGGCDFDMVLKQVRIAEPAYKAKNKKKKSGKKGVFAGVIITTPKKSTVKVGSVVVFTGGNVYVSSTAKKAVAKRNKSTCKVTAINSNKHPYHLISTDGGKVNGWVDKSSIQAKSSTTAKAKTSKGTKQVVSGNKKAVYHNVKKGNTVYTLVNKNYKSLGKTVKWVVDNNPKCFSKKGNPTTLIIGSKLLMGYKD